MFWREQQQQQLDFLQGAWLGVWEIDQCSAVTFCLLDKNRNLRMARPIEIDPGRILCKNMGPH